jgi:hypothetical protein
MGFYIHINCTKNKLVFQEVVIKFISAQYVIVKCIAARCLLTNKNFTCRMCRHKLSLLLMNETAKRTARVFGRPVLHFKDDEPQMRGYKLNLFI